MASLLSLQRFVHELILFVGDDVLQADQPLGRFGAKYSC